MVRIISTAHLSAASGESFYDRSVDGVFYDADPSYQRRAAALKRLSAPPVQPEPPAPEPIDKLLGDPCEEEDFTW